MKPGTRNASLLLHARQPEWQPTTLDELVTVLRDTGLIGAAIDSATVTRADPARTTDTSAYYAGERFLELIAFMGCSPNIRFTPESDGQSFTCIRLQLTPGRVEALYSPHSHAPICPHCGKAEKNWQRLIEADALCCSHCGQRAAPWHYNWRKSAGFAACFVEITDIYPKEALPQQSLLQALATLSGCEWLYFYHYR